MGRVALPAVLAKVHHSPEPLYVPTEVNTLQADGLFRIPVLTQALYRLRAFFFLFCLILKHITPLLRRTVWVPVVLQSV